jgi:outer membrane murein-binding lipoprotein Lpp
MEESGRWIAVLVVAAAIVALLIVAGGDSSHTRSQSAPAMAAVSLEV